MRSRVPMNYFPLILYNISSSCLNQRCLWWNATIPFTFMVSQTQQRQIFKTCWDLCWRLQYTGVLTLVHSVLLPSTGIMTYCSCSNFCSPECKQWWLNWTNQTLRILIKQSLSTLLRKRPSKIGDFQGCLTTFALF